MPAGGRLRASASSCCFFFAAACSGFIAHSILPQKSLCVALFQSPFGAVKTSGEKCPTSSAHAAVKE